MKRLVGLRVLATLGAGLSITAWPAHADFISVSDTSGAGTLGTKNAGMVWADFNNDGFPDLAVNVSTPPQSYLYYSDGGNPPTFTDVTSTHIAGFVARGGTRSLLAADFDNDGTLDIVRTGGRLEVYLNTGSPEYTFGDAAQNPNFEVDATTVTFAFNIEGAGVLDFDDDGWLDVLFQNEGGFRLLRNTGDAILFEHVDMSTTGIDPGPDMGGAGDYVAVTDFDADGHADFAGRTFGEPDIYHADGDGTFTAVAVPDLIGPNDRKGGVAFCDFDSDGDFDYFFTDGEGPGINSVWVNEAGAFTDSGEPGLDPDPLVTRMWSVACGDVDNDGDVDLYLVSQTADQLLINQWADTGGLSFVADSMGLGTPGAGRDAVFVDYDRDGDLDLAVHETPDNDLWENDANDAGGNGYLMVRVLADVGTCPGPPILRDDIGATVSLATVSGAWTAGVREVNGGRGHGSQDPALIHFGLPMGAAEQYALSVRFQHGDEPLASVRVTPASIGAYQLLEVVDNDPDGDSITTAAEMADAAGAPDTDGDGLPAWFDDDSDGDGLLDSMEAGDSDRCTPAVDGDMDGLADYLDPDVSPPDAGPRPDGGRADAGPRTDAGGAVDGGPGLLVHGSGWLCSAVHDGRVAASGRVLAFCLVMVVWLRARRRRRVL